MNAVVYVSKGGNTKKLADAVAKGAGVKAQSAASAANLTQADILFIGGSLYCGRISGVLRKFLQNLDQKQAAKVAVFGTSASGKSIRAKVMSILEPKGISIVAESFYCKGSFLCVNLGRPNADDLAQAEEFARRACKGGV
ncbi:MAG: flavodoxin [Treponema sp.]|jgi:flavodoxin|nr:flavodoxin [Treponema sp.]